MGEWVEMPDRSWRYDANVVSADSPAVTHIFNQVAPLDPIAGTAGEQDHTDPWRFAGEDASPPGVV